MFRLTRLKPMPSVSCTGIPVRLIIPEPMLSDIPDPIARYISSAAYMGVPVSWNGIRFYEYRGLLMASIGGVQEVVIGEFMASNISDPEKTYMRSAIHIGLPTFYSEVKFHRYNNLLFAVLGDKMREIVIGEFIGGAK